MADVKITQVRTVSIPVADQDRALKFYTEGLGFEIKMQTEYGPGMRWIEVGPVGSDTTIALPPLGELMPGVDTGIRLTTENAASTHEALSAAGADVGEMMRFPNVPPMFSLKDPDGNTLYVVEQM